ncbi:hypothetical protein GWI33_001035 [Rhynchophorus ferrugineus]|uniref:Uncharacterized protein n=1 Tax=Rhynchophorus ferrugineus TaxID=354439 RepID=A0A834HLF2_RHYFE|nr:hypothetical protein GWI33_001866 [Rhynchophorus ferrugineus]KAF7263844.1 hypothetical protein GWI33_001035 [Rhynchophorus ferrugineus]
MGLVQIQPYGTIQYVPSAADSSCHLRRQFQRNRLRVLGWRSVSFTTSRRAYVCVRAAISRRIGRGQGWTQSMELGAGPGACGGSGDAWAASFTTSMLLL